LVTQTHHGHHCLRPTPVSKKTAAAASIQAKTMEKVAQGYARIVPWDAINYNPPKKLKISPIVAVPHKSHLFCTILDLSFKLHLHGK